MRVKNRLITLLSMEEHRQLLSLVEPVSLVAGDVLHQVGKPIEFIYFPETSLICLLSVTTDGTPVEVGLIGNQGTVGASVVLEELDSPFQTEVQISGTGLRMGANVVREELNHNSEVHRLLLRYTHLLLSEVSQAALCSHLHSVRERFCRWLLQAQDLTGVRSFEITQDYLAHTLCVRRASIGEAAINLQQEGLISYSRGKLQILNRRGLELQTCGCYRQIKNSYTSFYRRRAAAM